MRVGRVIGLGLAATLSGCAATRPALAPAEAPLADHPRVVMLPLVNLSGRLGQGDVISRIMFSELIRTRTCEAVDYGESERIVEEMRLRDTGSLTAAQLQDLARRTGARYGLLGSILEAGTVHSPDGDIPVLGVALRLVELSSARVVWADARFASGQDRETVFGWGRELSLMRVTERLAAELFKDFATLAGGAAPAVLFALLWFGLQILQGTHEIFVPSMAEGVAWWAHIGGFVFGVLAALPVRRGVWGRQVRTSQWNVQDFRNSRGRFPGPWSRG